MSENVEQVEQTEQAEGAQDKTQDGATEAQKTEIQRLKLTVDGKEEELTQEEASKLISESRRAAQIKREGYKAFEEAATLRKQFTAIKDIIHADPTAGIMELAQLFGLPQNVLDQMFAQRAEFEQAWSKLNDDQKARWIAERRAAQLEGERRQKEEQAQQAKEEAEYRQKLDAEEKRLAKETLPAMQRVNLPASPLTVKMVAATLGALAERDQGEPNIDEAVEYVAQIWHQVTDGFIINFERDPAAFLKRYPAVSEALRKHFVAQATGRAPGSGKAPQPRAAPQESNGSAKSETWDEFSRRIKAIQRGETA